MVAADPLRVALVGYGLAGESFHAPLLRATEGIELAAVVTSDPDRRRRARAACPGAMLVENASTLWSRASDLGIEVAVVATPNKTHVPIAMDAFAAGLSVVVDKPLAATADDGRRLAAEAERRALLLSVFHNRRWDGDFRTVKRLVDDGTLGEVWRFESRYERSRPQRSIEAWRERGDPAEAGGLLFDLGSHLVDQAVALFGPPASVYAELDRRRAGTVVDDDAFVALRHPTVSDRTFGRAPSPAGPGPAFVSSGHDRVTSSGAWTRRKKHSGEESCPANPALRGG